MQLIYLNNILSNFPTVNTYYMYIVLSPVLITTACRVMTTATTSLPPSSVSTLHTTPRHLKHEDIMYQIRTWAIQHWKNENIMDHVSRIMKTHGMEWNGFGMKILKHREVNHEDIMHVLY